ncbi:ABC transporter ATP-binding protein [Celerinatantimonas yamalensis]|uniref:ABC transporter ATP-binding protein n=1 Tax=Celerinatantimonas yamalensis TaxID=559956 RepID=A0ABW9G7J9_9GAMM
MPAIHLRNLTKTYSGAASPAVNNLNLEVKDGEFLCLLGPSGCGKTTILRMIAGIEPISQGEIAIGERVVDSMEQGCFIPPEKRNIGLVFQSYALWPHMSVAENITFGLKVKKLPADEIKARSQDVMNKLSIAPYAKRYPAQLSGGQQQRVALARMLAVNPDVLLLDEPLSNLDAALRLEMRAELRRIHETFGTTIIFVSHDQWEAMTLATTIAVMSEGHLQQVGTPHEIYALPVNRFVADFMGSPKLNQINLNQPESVLAKHLQQRFHLPKQIDSCGIRPEALILNKQCSYDALAMKITTIIPTGGSWIIELSNGAEPLHYSTQLHPQWQIGDLVFCQFPDDALHFFDADGTCHRFSEVNADTQQAC